ncbi:histidine--tRNA ligase [Clostridium baratii]|uniref:histidine--tRNA ligase n=1 Tax=Clostridium baratii TaxID=1561 RepID=UPI0009A28758|nr:histidine--tRNA ligase [Clostridium baratii]OPF51147.1 histidine--tRNA ligase [Clostridium baratii]OPF55777.1 histidine--tRNA ligase [Clostridium baratii]OPF56843.1 histidine--tRNA ligase [Clostridium baratii]OPF59842.1 histidine--tRNA ligase [Clostridium baratii]
MKRNIIKPSILSGFMELLPKEQKIFNDIVSKITKVYEDNGCLGIDTPIIEKEEVLLAKSGGETEKQVYSFQKGKNNLALRFDLTVPFARYVAQYYNDLVFPFKRYQIGKVYRGERNQKGRYREFYQCDIDVIGKEKLSIDNDAWVISLASKAFKAIGLNNYRFQISNRKILKGILSELKIDKPNEVMILIDKYDKIGKKIFSKELESLIGAEQSQYINKVLDISGTNKERIEELLKFNITNKDFIEGIEELSKVCYILKILGVSDEEFEINLKIIRGLDYYTGTVFETILVGNESYGSICSGGRYDNLAENYTNNILPGVGISIGLTRLFFVLKEIGFIDKYEIKKGLDYLIIPIGNTVEYCVEVMRRLQEKGKRVTVYFEEDSLKKKMNYANKIGVSNVILIGEEEIEKNEVKIKNMNSGESKNVNMNNLELF